MFEAKFALGLYSEAEAFARRILRVSPLEANAHLNIGAALEMQGKSAQAKRHYRQELVIHPDSAEAHYNLGMLLARRCQWRRAWPHVKYCLLNKKFKWNAEYELLAARTAYEAGERNLEMMIYKEALKADPKNYWALTNLAAALMDQSNFDEAKCLLRKASKVKPEDRLIQKHLAKCSQKTSQSS